MFAWPTRRAIFSCRWNHCSSVMVALDFHELANLFPMMTVDDANALGDDIKVNGQHEPIWLYEDKVLDDRNRYLQCIRVDVEPALRPYLGETRSRSSSRLTSSVVTRMKASVPSLRRSWRTCRHIVRTAPGRRS
jgi:hypothetical protein